MSTECETRPTSAQDHALLKTATRALIRAAGGVEGAAMITRVGKSQLSNYQSPNHDSEFMPLDILADLERDAGTPFVTRALAAMSGGYFTPIKQSASKKELAAHIASIGKEISDVMHHASTALIDAKISDKEAETITREIDEAIQALAAARQYLNAA